MLFSLDRLDSYFSLCVVGKGELLFYCAVVSQRSAVECCLRKRIRNEKAIGASHHRRHAPLHGSESIRHGGIDRLQPCLKLCRALCDQTGGFRKLIGGRLFQCVRLRLGLRQDRHGFVRRCVSSTRASIDCVDLPFVFVSHFDCTSILTRSLEN